MLLKGFALDGERVDFALDSCPVSISKDAVALIGAKGSKLLQAGTIVRGNEENGIFEGDVVYDGDKKIGIIIYSQGFVMQDLEGALKKIPEGEHIKVKVGNSQTVKEANNCELKSTLLLQYQDESFPIQSLMFKTNGMLVVSKLRNVLIEPVDLMFSTGYCRDDGTQICFGEFYKGGTVVLHNNVPCVKLSDTEYVELKNNVQ